MTEQPHDPAETENELDVQSGFVPSGLDEYGLKVWEELTPALIAVSRLKQTDVPAMRRYCDLAGMYWKISEQIARDGETYWAVTVAQKQTEDGEPAETNRMLRKHPLLNEKRALAAELRQLEAQFGMSPLARQNLVTRQLSRPPGELPFGQGKSQPGPSVSGPDNFRRN